MGRWQVYLLLCVASAAVFAAFVVIASNLYWGASARPGGDYYLFGRPMPGPFGPLLWASIKPLLLVTPVALCWSLYMGVRAWRGRHAPGFCRKCGYDLRGNVSGVCPECGQAT